MVYMIPVIIELFIEAPDGRKYALYREYNRIERLATSFSWIRPESSPIRKLLMNGWYSFPNAWIVERRKRKKDELRHVQLNEILTKGFCIVHKGKTFIMPLGNFDHD